jgi:two-component system, chemotaxis family, sensor kinase CheA
VSGQEEEFLRALRATFKVEAAEHLQVISAGLLELERDPASAKQGHITETVFRAAHSLKGAARAVNLTDIESLCQSLEDLFATWKRREALPAPQQIDSAQHSVDRMSQMIAEPALADSTGGEVAAATAGSATAGAAVVQPSPGLMGETETVRIAVRSLDARLLEAEEMLAAKMASGQRAADLGALAAGFEQWHKAWARIHPQVRALRKVTEPPADAATADLYGLAEFIEWNHDYLRSLETKVATLRRSAEQDYLSVGKLVEDLLENSKKLAMLPMATLGALLPKLVRDLCRDQAKEAELSIRGEEVKIDKRILEEMKDPLIHLLRNCVDHGIEAPELRRRSGKPPRAAITLTVTPVNGSEVEIAVSDDGAGIDVERVKAVARERGLIAADAAEKLTESAALALVFEADVSTSPMITQVSGRGLGLAIVRENTERLGGRVAIQSSRNAGTTIRMTLPLTLATFRGVLIEASQRLFVIPTSQVERVSRFTPGDVATVEGRDTLAMNGRTVALAGLAQVLRLPPAGRAPEPGRAIPVLVLGSGEQRVAFAVDAVLDEREVLVKKFAKPLLRVRNIAGATILGSGEVALILNVPDLLRSARATGSGVRAGADAPPVATASKKILVVEDSITSRMLLKGILESAGYEVKTAVDGIDAFTALRAEQFDLVVSDVEMPRMNGLDLTARIREDHTLAHTPVVLVTALESREDRERGVDVGANAYLVKSSLDQSNLLSALRQLA